MSDPPRPRGVDVRCALHIFRRPMVLWRSLGVEDPRNLNSCRDDGWTIIDISDRKELPLDTWGPVEVKHHLPFNKISTVEFVKQFKAIFGDFRDNNPIKVIIISQGLNGMLKVLETIARLERNKPIKVLLTFKDNIEGMEKLGIQ